MVMEFVEGVTIEKRAGESAIPLKDVLAYADQVLGCPQLRAQQRRNPPRHKAGQHHAYLSRPGQAHGFGIAKSTTDLQLTRPGTTMGSVYYMSPEQVRGGTVDARSDIYSFGVTLYEMLTGRRPFQAETAYTVSTRS